MIAQVVSSFEVDKRASLARLIVPNLIRELVQVLCHLKFQTG
jgi:hypothetical protein